MSEGGRPVPFLRSHGYLPPATGARELYLGVPPVPDSPTLPPTSRPPNPDDDPEVSESNRRPPSQADLNDLVRQATAEVERRLTPALSDLGQQLSQLTQTIRRQSEQDTDDDDEVIPQTPVPEPRRAPAPLSNYPYPDPRPVPVSQFPVFPEDPGIHIQPVIPMDPRFAKVLHFETYRLMKRAQTYNSRVARKIADYVRQISVSMREMKFDGLDPLSVFQFLSSLRNALDQNGLHEGAALYILPSFLQNPALDSFTTFFQDGGVLSTSRSYPGAINYLLRSYADEGLLAAEFTSVTTLKQMSGESVREFAIRLQRASNRLGSAVAESTLRSSFMQGLNGSTAGLVRHMIPNIGVMPFEQLVTKADGVGQAVGSMLPQRSLARAVRVEQAVPRVTTRSNVLSVHSDLQTPSQDPEKEEDSTKIEVGVDEGVFVVTPSARSSRDPRPQERYCWTCWRPGHLAYDCPLIPEDERARIALRREQALGRGKNWIREAVYYDTGRRRKVELPPEEESSDQEN